MALIICPECGKEFSDKAPACPNCGFPTNELLETAPSEEPTPSDNSDSLANGLVSKAIGAVQTTIENNKKAPKATKQIGPVQIDETHRLFRINGAISY